MKKLLKVIECNFTTKNDWIFKLKDEDGQVHYLMESRFYDKHNLKTPITRLHLDSLDVGHCLLSETTVIDGLYIITKIQ